MSRNPYQEGPYICNHYGFPGFRYLKPDGLLGTLWVNKPKPPTKTVSSQIPTHEQKPPRR